MSRNRTAVVESANQGSRKTGRKIAEIGMLVWMLGITALWWLLYGPGMTFITVRLGILPGHAALRTTLLQFFTFTSWGVR